MLIKPTDNPNPKFILKNGVVMPDHWQQQVVAVPIGQMPLLLKYAVEYNVELRRFEFNKVFKEFLKTDNGDFVLSADFNDAFYISASEHGVLFDQMHKKNFHKAYFAIINTATLQMQNGLGSLLDSSEFQQLMEGHLAGLQKAIDDRRKTSGMQTVHICTGAA